MPHVTAVRVAIVLASLGIGSITPMAQPPEGQLMTKPLPPELERIIQAMPPSARATVRHMLETDPAMRRRAELGEMLMAQKRPHWTRETVLRKIRAVFPGSDPAHMLGTLENGGGEGARVQLAVIKLCDEGRGLSELPHYVNTAKLDYRDVLAWAEQPNVIRLPPSASDSDREEADRSDLQQYLRWIEQDRREKP
jgi:hypothetical protein